MLLLGEDKAQAEKVVPVVGGVAVAIRSATVIRIEAKAAPTANAVSTTRSTSRVGL